MGARRTEKLIPSLLLLAAILPSAVSAETLQPLSVCFPAIPHYLGDQDGNKNFLFKARIRGSTTPDAEGYWIVAVDGFNNGWAQLPTGMRNNGTSINASVPAFSISNISSYPLSFVVMKSGGTGDLSYSAVKAGARDGNRYSMSDADFKNHIVSRLDACVVPLVNDVPNVAKCTCP